eukprot:757480-Hanusia_phi.AAC.4
MDPSACPVTTLLSGSQSESVLEAQDVILTVKPCSSFLLPEASFSPLTVHASSKDSEPTYTFPSSSSMHAHSTESRAGLGSDRRKVERDRSHRKTLPSCPPETAMPWLRERTRQLTALRCALHPWRFLSSSFMGRLHQLSWLMSHSRTQPSCPPVAMTMPSLVKAIDVTKPSCRLNSTANTFFESYRQMLRDPGKARLGMKHCSVTGWKAMKPWSSFFQQELRSTLLASSSSGFSIAENGGSKTCLGGCGRWKSCLGDCPKWLICATTA